jgi:hypothetical protein
VQEEISFGLGFVVDLDFEVSDAGCEIKVSGATARITGIPKAMAAV